MVPAKLPLSNSYWACCIPIAARPLSWAAPLAPETNSLKLASCQRILIFTHTDALIKERVKLLVEKVSLENACDRPTGKYSKGMLQRLGIAQALINDPQVLFLDEPMSGLDPLGRMDVRRILHELKDEGKTIFFNSHLLPDVGELCDRVGLLVQGKMVADSAVSDIAKDGNFKALEDFFLEHVKLEADKAKAQETQIESKP
jgi:ABC-type multidrug transport system ATPase subunit